MKSLFRQDILIELEEDVYDCLSEEELSSVCEMLDEALTEAIGAVRQKLETIPMRVTFQ